MNLVPVLARAFGVDPDRFEAQVEAYESPGIVAPEADRLTLIERRHEEAGRGDADKSWLIAECKRLRLRLAQEHADVRSHMERGVAALLDEALNSGDGVYRP